MTIPFKNLVEMQEYSTQTFADRPIYGTKVNGTYQWMTYREFGEQVNHFRAGLAALSVAKGDKVAVISANSTKWAIGAYATYGLGAHYVPMYETQLYEDWKYIVNDCKAKVLLVANTEIFEKTQSLISEIDSLQTVINLQDGAEGASSYDGVIASGKEKAVASIFPAESDTMGLIYTSGTTGKPKGVELSHGNILCNVRIFDDLFKVSPDDRSLAFLPWAHVFGQVGEVHLLIALGFSAGFVESVNTIVENLAEIRPTLFMSVPRVYNKIYDGVNEKMRNAPGPIQALFKKGMELAKKKSSGESLGFVESLTFALADKVIFNKIRGRFGGRLRYAFSGASALNPAVAEFLGNLNIPVYEGYGLSETSPIISCNAPAYYKLGTVGKVAPGITVKIDTSVGNSDVEGEIINYGPNTMKGYFNLPEETAKVMTNDGGFRTGDLGRIDEDGFLKITGRIKEQYKLENGKYVVPSPLEEELKLSPFISQAFLYGSNKKYNVAIIVAEAAKLKQYASANGLSDDLGSLVREQKIKELFLSEIKSNSMSFKGYEVPKNIAIVTEEWTTDNGFLTPTLKLKRNKVYEAYQNQIEGLYQ